MSNSYKLTGREIRRGDFVIENPLGDSLLFEHKVFGVFGEEDGYNICLSCYGNPDEIFFNGVETVNTDKNDDYINVYINCNFDCTEVDDHLTVVYYHYNPETKEDECCDYVRELNEKEQLIIKELILAAQIYYLNTKLSVCTRKLSFMK